MKVTASLTEKRSYHTAMIDGEAPEMLDPQDNIGSDIGPGDAIKAGLASLQGQAAAGNLANFADGDAVLYFFDTKEV